MKIKEFRISGVSNGYVVEIEDDILIESIYFETLSGVKNWLNNKLKF